MIGWIQLSRSAVASAEQALKADSQGVRDEVGFLALHQAFSDRFFPGTSVLHTRLRYVLFIPWLMERAGGDPALLRKYELELTKQLKDYPKGNQGVIGATVWPDEPSQTPSMAYWSALNRWGILRPRADGATASRRQTLKRIEAIHQQSAGRRHEVDGEQLYEHEPSPFAQLPAPPLELLKAGETLDFRLSKDERAFMRRQLLGLRRSPECPEQSLLARLVEERLPVADIDTPWADSILAVASEEDRRALLLAKNMSALAGIGRAVYAALVEQLKANGSSDYPARHRDHLDEMVTVHGKAARALDIDQLKALIPGLSTQLLAVLNVTQQWLNSKTSALTELQPVYANAESLRKGARARLASSLAGQKRRAEWESDEHPLAEPLHYRWRNVRTLLTDLSA